MDDGDKLIEGEDYYIDPSTGLLTFTESYLLKRGYCCDNGCRHCPFKDPLKPAHGPR